MVKSMIVTKANIRFKFIISSVGWVPEKNYRPGYTLFRPKACCNVTNTHVEKKLSLQKQLLALPDKPLT